MHLPSHLTPLLASRAVISNSSLLQALGIELNLPAGGPVASSWSSISEVLATASANNIPAARSALSDFATLLQTVQPTATPTANSQLLALPSSLLPAASAAPTPNLVETLQTALALTLAGLNIGNDSVLDLLEQSLAPDINGQTDGHPDPPYAVYPKRAPGDAPYSQSEHDLRRAIFIPDSFTFGKKQPVILSPGTGLFGGEDFITNLIPLLQNSSFGDPVWINPPSQTLGDAQLTAEIDAYAINYIAAISGRKVAAITESQGSLDVQWALKYWPSTRQNMTDFIPVSGDLKGTILFDDPAADLSGIPAFFQQRNTGSDFIATLRSNNGSSAYVPTTAIYTATDEIVEPQQGVGASGYFDDVRGVGVTNNEIQTVCPLLPAGGPFGHIDVLLNSLVWALIKDALTHPGPGRTSRLDLSVVCNEVLAPGLTAADLLATFPLLPAVVVDVLLYEPKVTAEPAIMAYARS